MGARVTTTDETTITLEPGGDLSALGSFHVPADPSAAAFYGAAAALVPGSQVRARGVGLKSPAGPGSSTPSPGWGRE